MKKVEAIIKPFKLDEVKISGGYEPSADLTYQARFNCLCELALIRRSVIRQAYINRPFG